MSRSSKRIPIGLSLRHADYLLELIEDDLELDDEEDILSEEERLMVKSLQRRLQEVEPAVNKWHQQQKRLEGR